MELNRYKINILGLPAHKIDINMARDYVDYMLNNGAQSSYIIAQNAEKIMMALHDSGMREIIENANLIIPDGVGVSLATKILYRYPTDRVPGYDLFREILNLSKDKNYKIFLLGSREEVVENAHKRLTDEYRGLNIVGHHHGYFTDDFPILKIINKIKPDILFVGMGSPRQEQWIYHNRNKLNVKVLMGVGGSFDVVAGFAELAPAFWRNNGLEFVYRLLKNPSRIKRQLVFLKFLFLLLAVRTKLIRNLT
jgi:N-acetylglucosaminyldiphosphoundecaprenol N-acetyl-beta-D-mannosaminyltransferase